MLSPGANIALGDIFNIMIADQVTIAGLQLRTTGFDGRLDVVTLTAGADSGRKRLQLTVIPEPSSVVLLLLSGLTAMPITGRVRSTRQR